MKILSYDIESTTGSHSDGSMCTFGYCIADEKFNIIEQRDIVMRPHGKRYEPRIKLHYDKAFIKAQKPFPEYYEEIKRLFKESDLIIGFSVSNDVDFLNNACDIYKLDKIEYEFLDIQLLHKTVEKRQNASGLESVANEMGIEYLAHRSDEDARVTLLLLKNITESLGLTIDGVLNKYHITQGVNSKIETTPCTNGVYTKKELNCLINDFIDKNYRHNRRYKGGLSYKSFAFSDELKYGDVDTYRRAIKKIYELNGRVGQIENCNHFVSKDGTFTEKEKKSLTLRNEGRKRITPITFDAFINMVGELPAIDFSGDSELIKKHRREARQKRLEKRAEYLKQKSLEKKSQQNKNSK
ncbi:MAG: 3'-5' exonuclease [Clostridia bacterium]|nr:3'-5' exonuclease [Clostridia bacterium]